MKKVVLLSLVLVLALAGVGIGYAQWSDSLTIDGTVTTGSVDICIADVGTLDDGPDPAQSPGANTDQMDVASHTSENIGDIVCTKTVGDCEVPFYASVTEDITNAYPYYASGTLLLLANCGTIPVKISGIDLTTSGVVNDGDLILDHLIITDWALDLDGVVFETGSGQTALETALAGYQLHPCHFLSVVFGFYFDGGTPQSSSVTYQIVVTATQWNA